MTEPYPENVACSFCRVDLGQRLTAVRVRTVTGDCFDLCEPCYRGYWLVEADDELEQFEPRLSLRSIVAQRATLMLIRHLVSAGLEPDEPANVELMQCVADLLLHGVAS
jgi:hypothetical protein